jgi:predicted NBD/HSP70 family sugar kinase
VTIALCRPDGTVFVRRERLLPHGHPQDASTFRFVERLLKFLLWQWGGSRVVLAGAPEIAAALAEVYRPGGERCFDAQFMGETVFAEPFSIAAVELAEIPPPGESSLAAGGSLAGCRIGFDLGGSDRKAAALIDGQVVFSEEIAWDPYFQSDPEYHLAGVQDSLQRAAAHLPRVDAIGGSAAGVYINNQPRVGSLFRGVPADLFAARIRPMFLELQRRWNGVPFAVANDGEVTALAGSQMLGSPAVLGISMGTSQAAGYVTPEGSITSWLNELAFAPIDYDPNAAVDEWSGDRGCGVQYFSQQGVARFAAIAGFDFPAAMPLAERLVEVQNAMVREDPRAARVYDTIGVCFGYALAHYADFYAFKHLLLLGRVTSGAGGERIAAVAMETLRTEFPALASSIQVTTPDEKMKRHGQAIAAASLPQVSPQTGPVSLDFTSRSPSVSA